MMKDGFGRGGVGGVLMTGTWMGDRLSCWYVQIQSDRYPAAITGI